MYNLLISVGVFTTLLILCSLEYVIYKRSRKKYAWQEGLVSFLVYVGVVIKRILIGGILIAVGNYFYEYKLFDIDSTISTLALLMLLVEIFYYCQHRLAHTIRFWWASHAVHHSPNQINFATAVRLSWTSEISGMFLIYMPIVFLGFPTKLVFLTIFFNLLYQLWLHTEVVGRLPKFIELIFNTPSHHRVHHGANDEYIDKNFGGILIIWDKIFGSYQEEKEEIPIKYGLVKPVHSNNPLYVVFHEWVNLFKELRTARNVKDILIIVFGRPGTYSKTEMKLNSK